jgi:hypothetical protein
MALRQSPRAVFDKDMGLRSNLLSAAGFSGAIKESIIETSVAPVKSRLDEASNMGLIFVFHKDRNSLQPQFLTVFRTSEG